jgi:hypothetical protein
MKCVFVVYELRGWKGTRVPLKAWDRETHAERFAEERSEETGRVCEIEPVECGDADELVELTEDRGYNDLSMAFTEKISLDR